MLEQIAPVKVETKALALPPGASADQSILYTRVEALRARIKRRAPAIREEIEVMLDGVSAVAFGVPGDVAKGEALLADARARYERALQTSNRNWYLVALVFGTAVLGVLASVTAYLARTKFANLAPPATIISLFVFAGMGSVTSVLTRINSLDLGGEDSRKFVFYSAVAKPLVAVSFASVVYVMLANELVKIGDFSGERLQAFILVAIFLCGFSERFAEDMLSRVIPLADSDSGSPKAATGTEETAKPNNK